MELGVAELSLHWWHHKFFFLQQMLKLRVCDLIRIVKGTWMQAVHHRTQPCVKCAQKF